MEGFQSKTHRKSRRHCLKSPSSGRQELDIAVEKHSQARHGKPVVVHVSQGIPADMVGWKNVARSLARPRVIPWSATHPTH